MGAKMTLSFPNPSRSFDFSRNAVSFVGYDDLTVVSFYVEAGALARSNEGDYSPDQCLIAFDRQTELIHDAARKVYSKGKSTSYLLKTTDF